MGAAALALPSEVAEIHPCQMDFRHNFEWLLSGIREASSREVPLFPTEQESSKETSTSTGDATSIGHRSGGTHSTGIEGLQSLFHFFVVPKRNGDWRSILDLKFMNHHIRLCRFHMESLQPREFMTSLELTEAYLHVPLLPSHRRFLRFSF